MRRWSWIFALLGLVACDAPSLHFAGVTPVRVDVGGSVFDVRVRGDLAEAIRVNPQYAPRLGRIRDRAVVAMAAVSGCQVTGLLGDQAVQVGTLDCGDPGGQGRPVPVLVPDYDCLDLPSGVTRPDGLDYVDYDCSAY